LILETGHKFCNFANVSMLGILFLAPKIDYFQGNKRGGVTSYCVRNLVVCYVVICFLQQFLPHNVSVSYVLSALRLLVHAPKTLLKLFQI
jgi:hypothetical protein